MSLLEVLVATSIFLLALIGLSQLVSLSSDKALEIQFRSEATQLCQSKLAEIVSGALPLQSGSDTFQEAPDYQWTATVNSGSITNLYDVTVTVSRQRANGTTLEVSLNQSVLDPSVIGSTQDVSAVSGSDQTNAPSSSGQSGSSGSGAGTPSTPTPAAPAASPAPAAAAPRVTTPAPAATTPRTPTPAPSSSPSRGSSGTPKGGGG
jgi:Tfp pilus assembly protein PilV